ncbi:MAG: LPS assembly lipoprotein LptE [Porticoccaceae bacterium]
MKERRTKISSTALVRSCLALFLSTAVVSGCGWQLRGAGMIPEDLKTLHVVSRDPNGKLSRELARALRSAGVEVPASTADAQLSLVITQERSLVRVATVNENARVSEQELTEEATFMVVDKEGIQAVPLSTVTVQRIFEYNEDNVLATQDERELIRKEMRRDLISQMLNRLRQLREQPDAPAP